MKNLLYIFIISAFVMLSGCKKDLAPAANDPTTPWVGTYNVANPVGNNGVTQIQIIRAGNNSLRVILKMQQFSYLYTATTLQNVTISGTTATINETQNIIEQTDLGPYVFSGTMQISGGVAVLSSSAVSVQTPNNSDVSPLNFNFSGAKVN
jgi:hypothetical protein